MSLRVVVLVMLALGVAPAPEGWQLEVRAGAGCWPPACRADQVPLGISVAAFGDRLLMFGDGAASDRIYSSADGMTWREQRTAAAWGRRYGFAIASFHGALWRVAGFEDGTRREFNDVWRSRDGISWELVTEHAPWSPRTRPQLIEFNGALWLVGGAAGHSAAWRTTDGVRWTPVHTIPLRAADASVAYVFRGKLWLIGGGGWDHTDNDVWSSADGVTWTQALTPPWRPRVAPGGGVLGDRLWIYGGVNMRDAWYTTDGERWTSAGSVPWDIPRASDHHVTFANRLWLFGGKTGGAGGIGYSDEVWSFDGTAPR